MTTILIPIDFHVESLNTLRLALSKRQHEQVHVILMFAANLNDSITDLLFYSAAKRLKDLSTPEFEEAIAILRNRYETVIRSLRVELFHGYNASAFKKFLEAHDVSQVIIPKQYKLHSKKGFNPLPLIRKSGIDLTEVEWTSPSQDSDKDALNYLFI